MRQLGATTILLLFTFKPDSLRASPDSGPQRLAALMSAKAPEIAAMKAGLAAGQSRREWTHLRAQIDAAAHQKDAAWSGLYWYTSLPEALAAAKREGKPVLSLRLLGHLDEELSCANSRFFRTVLYANEEISKELRENWILHWESVRAAPKITIDYGDGRVLTRTITGNSLHYVLDAEGRAVDVLPGLWEPAEFLRSVREARGVAPPPAESRAFRPFPLDSNSLLLMRAKAPRLDDAAFERMAMTFQRTLAQDTARNKSLRRQILPWLAEAGSLSGLTDRIYRDAFLTPRSDPWLGLLPADVYSAIEGEPPGVAGPDARAAGILAPSKLAIQRPLLPSVVPAVR